MNKKLTAKTQKLVPTQGENEPVISSCIVIEPPERELVLKKGCVYLVFHLECPASLDTSLVSKMVNDVLYDSYYRSDNVSPIQSLEKSLLSISEKITSLAAQSVQDQRGPKEKKPVFDAIAGVLWGNVMYMVQYGKGRSFLMREGAIKEVSATAEGNFSVASGVVREDDVVVLNTENFAQEYPPEKLLATSISPNGLKAGQSCIIIKFIVDTEFTDDEVVDFNIKKSKNTGKLVSFFHNLKEKRSSQKKEKPIATLMDAAESQPTLRKTPGIKIRSDKSFRPNRNTVLAILIILLAISILSSILLKGEKKPVEKPDKSSTKSEIKEDQTPHQAETQLEDTEKDEENKISRVAIEPFYDLTLADSNADPYDIAAFNNTVVVVDAKLGKIFSSSLESPKFTAEEGAYEGVRNSVNYEGKLNFADNSGYKTYDLTTQKITETFEQPLGLTNTYFGYIYSVEGSELKKYTKTGNTLTSSIWAKSDDFDGAKAISVAYSIYLLTKEDKLVVYTQGQKTDFNITGLEPPFSNATDLVVNVDLDNMYIADAGNRRVVVLSSKGEYIRQYKAVNSTVWNNLRSISVDPDESKLFVLDGAKVYVVNLTAE